MGTNVSYERKTLVRGNWGWATQEPSVSDSQSCRSKTSKICVLTTMARAQYFTVIMSATLWAHSYITCDQSPQNKLKVRVTNSGAGIWQRPVPCPAVAPNQGAG